MDHLLKRKLAAGKKPVGTFINSNSAYVVEALGYTGFDYVIFDNEHAPLEAETTCELVRAAENAGICPIARVREVSRPAVMKLLDVGARGLVIPNVKTVDQVKEVVMYGKYPPIGQRGFGTSRMNGWGYGEPSDIRELMQLMNDNILILPQCETVEALGIVEDIVALKGVDGIFIGPFDLSVSMGIPGEFSQPQFKEAIRNIIDTCHRYKKICMKYASTEEMAALDFINGVDTVTFNTDLGMLIEAGRDNLSGIRDLV